MKLIKNNYVVYLLVTLVTFFVLGIGLNEVRASNTAHPKRANYYLSWTLTETQARELARWDMVILDMEIQERHPDLLVKMRQWNPNIKMLVYITPQEIRQDAHNSFSIMRKKLAGNIHSDWYLTNIFNTRLSWWPETYLLNVTNKSPLRNGGKHWNDRLVDFVVDDLLATGYWDGVFYDNAWDNITYFVGNNNIDLDKDGAIDADADNEWRKGMKYIYSQTREKAGKDIIIIGNGTSREYLKELDGQMFENFHQFPWNDIMNWYDKFSDTEHQYSIINANTGNVGDNTSYKDVRFSFASTLLEDGYYSYDFGDKSHGQLWWYDEYDMNLGQAQGPATSNSGKHTYSQDVWRRNFENGAVLVNSTAQNQTVDLGAEFEKIHGTQDTTVNDGSIISEVSVAPSDGIVLLKVLSSLQDVVFRNGDFVRFLLPDGSRIKNGFFLSDALYKGGDYVSKIDLNGDNQRDVVVSSGARLRSWRSDGQPFMNVYPYTANYRGELYITIGDVTNDNKSEIIVSPSYGYRNPIKIYSHDGVQIRPDWYPFGRDYNGGYSISVSDIHGDGKAKITIGAGQGSEPLVAIFGSNLAFEHAWHPYEKKFLGGARLATGDVTGDGKKEIIVGPGPGKKPIIKVFDPFGSLLFKQFTAFTSFQDNGVQLQSVDVNFDGKDDILVFTNDVL